MKRIAVINQKGGVGKTATAYNLAYELGKKSSALLVDLDPSGNASRALLSSMETIEHTVKDLFIEKNFSPHLSIYKSSHGGELDVMPSKIGLATIEQVIVKRIHKERLLDNQLNKLNGYEYAIIDCSPTLSDLTINAMYTADFILIPIAYEDDALEGMKDLFDVLREVKEEQEFDFKVLRNGYDARKNTINSYINERIKHFNDDEKVFNTVIRQCEDINLAKLHRVPVSVFSSSCRGAEDYALLTEEILRA